MTGGFSMTNTIHPYQRLQNQLSELIMNTPAGERLPSEPQLARQLGVSRATLREAMRSFEGQGFIRRRQGIGTFVVGRPKVIESGLEVLQSIESLADKISLQVAMGDLKIKQIHADSESAEALQIDLDTPLVKIARVITAGKRPVAYLVDIMHEDVLTPTDLEQGFTGSVLDLLLQRGTPPLMNSYTEINAVAAPSEIARSLEIQRGDVLLMFQAKLFDESGRVVIYSKSYFIPGHFRFHVVRRVGHLTGVLTHE
jgi:GntR family transcriptional regulator